MPELRSALVMSCWSEVVARLQSAGMCDRSSESVEVITLRLPTSCPKNRRHLSAGRPDSFTRASYYVSNKKFSVFRSS